MFLALLIHHLMNMALSLHNSEIRGKIISHFLSITWGGSRIDCLVRLLAVKTNVGLEVCSEITSENLKVAMIAESVMKYGKYALKLPLLCALQRSSFQ